MPELLDNERLGALANGLLADAAFVFAEASDAFEPKGGALLFARISLRGDEGWELMVAAESDMAAVLAANLLGIDEGAAEARKASVDALAEWTNILAGAVAAELAGGAQLCRIGLPAVSAEPGVKASTLLGKSFRRANLVTESGHHVAVGLRPLEVT